MTRFAIQVTLKVQPGQAEAFLPRILDNARGAVRDEEDCLDFQVFQAEDDPDAFVLFEIYTDEEAWQAHRHTPHYERFAEEGRPLIAERQIRRLRAIPL